VVVGIFFPLVFLLELCVLCYGQIGFVLFCGMGSFIYIYIYIYIFHCINLMIIKTIQEVDSTSVHGSIL
jgi:hypothetical protein